MQHTYENYLKLLGITDEQLLSIMNEFDVVYVNTDILLKESIIEGIGSFTTRSYKPDEKIGKVMQGENKTELGRYVNHSCNPNIYLKQGWFIALKDIPPDTELIVNYHHNLETLKKEAV